MTPHPQRCETCENKQCGYHSSKISKYPSRIKDAVEVQYYLTAEKGCASHSTASNADKVLEKLNRDLKTRFVSSSNQWSRGRNSGLLECCNIIDEYLEQFRTRTQEQPVQQAGEP
ncbi:MAG: hypothetical protein M0Q91_05050 [Methanoregula sp.]|jgi:hypothetical protein|nr:hypothetical protein [Methanoregula sp.]